MFIGNQIEHQPHLPTSKMIQMEPVSSNPPNGESVRDDDYRQRILASM